VNLRNQYPDDYPTISSLVRAGVYALDNWKIDMRKLNCANCQGKLTFKSHHFPIGMICHACYMNAHKDDIIRWSGKVKEELEDG